MMGWGYGMGLGGWLVMSGLWLVLIVAAVMLATRLLRVEGGRPAAPSPGPGPTPREVLDQRLARGEIDVETHQMLLAELTRDPAAPR